jgi:uncharacterized protein (TIGR03435 family)
MPGPMTQTLLEDRLRLKIHRETREAPVYALTVAKGGIKMQRTKEPNCITIDPDQPPSTGSDKGSRLSAVAR